MLMVHQRRYLRQHATKEVSVTKELLDQHGQPIRRPELLSRRDAAFIKRHTATLLAVLAVIAGMIANVERIVRVIPVAQTDESQITAGEERISKLQDENLENPTLKQSSTPPLNAATEECCHLQTGNDLLRSYEPYAVDINIPIPDHILVASSVLGTSESTKMKFASQFMTLDSQPHTKPSLATSDLVSLLTTCRITFHGTRKCSTRSQAKRHFFQDMPVTQSLTSTRMLSANLAEARSSCISIRMHGRTRRSLS